ncbi:MAG TPA: chemotaxis protein CheA [Candidatus Acidoferrales bacterium]|nr:chemotaxis protein CheA [Candidatus Acidoferrales bacterium]
MNFFPDERAAELRELFFETAEELLQELNEAGLQLENHPDDAEIIRHVRRIIHTLKGDSAACGFRELSGLAHELEDALNPGSAKEMQHAVVDVIFTAADTFREMLSAYRKGVQPASGHELREQIRRITHFSPHSPARLRDADASPRFDWNEAQKAQIEEALGRGERVYNISLEIDPASGMRSAAFHMAHNILTKLGTILALYPGDSAALEHSSRIEAALASEHPRELLLGKCKIPAVIASVKVEEISNHQEPSQDLLDVVLQAEARASGAIPMAPHSRRGGDSIEFGTPAEPGKTSSSSDLQAHTLRVDADRIDTVLNLIGELIIGKSMLHRTIVEFDKHHPKDPFRSRFADALAIQSRVLEEIQRSVMKIRMVPVEHLFRRFPRIVRDVAKACGRDVAVEVAGETTDLDKSILDALAEPLAHLIRNAVNHGIETPQEREALGKPKRGTVRLNAYHQANQMVIEVSDDGRGIDTNKVTRRAIESGALSASEAEKLTHADTMRLIFQPGLSTADGITETSGRGVGMDVVAGALERLKGTVEIESAAGAGTKFRLMVPLTLASIQALLFRIDGKLYAAPLSNVVEITRISEDDLHRVDNHTVLRLRDELLTVARLRESDSKPVPAKKAFVVVIGAGERKFGLIVDALVGEEELVIKSLDDRFAASDIVSGASILGDGTVVLILNIAAVAGRIGRIPVLGAIA